MLTTTNNRARVHPALPRYFVVVQCRSFRGKGINGAVGREVGMLGAFRKWTAGRKLP